MACDVYRPAAIKQLEVVGGQLNIPVFQLGDKVNPVKIAKQGVEYAQKKTDTTWSSSIRPAGCRSTRP